MDCDTLCCIYIISQSTCCKVSIYKWNVICGVFCCIYIISHSTCCKVSIYNKWIVICGVLCCIYIISHSTCCMVSIYNKWIVICGILCCIYIISQFTCCKVSIYNKWIVICCFFPLCIYFAFYMIYCLFQIPYNTPHYRRLKSEQLKADLSSALYDEIQVDIRIYIDLPKKSDHNKHIMGDVCVT